MFAYFLALQRKVLEPDLCSMETLVSELLSSSSASLPKLPSERASSLLLSAGMYSRSENAIVYRGFLRTSVEHTENCTCEYVHACAHV